MFLKSFQISSYRSCQNTKFPLHKKLTAFIGANGSGKTNILNGILLLRKLFERRYRNLYFDESTKFNTCKIQAVFEHENITIHLHGAVKIETDEKNNDEIVYSDLKWKFSNYENDWLVIPIELFPSETNDDFARGISRRFPRTGNEELLELFRLFEDKTFKRKVVPLLNEISLFFNEISYYSATQFSNPNQCPISIELGESRPRRWMRLTPGHEQFIFDLYNSKKAESKEFIRYFNTVGKNGIALIDNLEFETLSIPSSTYKVQSGGQIRQINGERLLIVPIFTIDGRKLSPNQLSEGTFKTLALLFYILTNKSRILLIEEPEVCVHHGLLDSVIKLIIGQSECKQIFISTHSDFVLDLLSPENILLVKYLKNKGTIVNSLEDSMCKSSYNALKDYLKESGNLGEYWREGGFNYD